MSLREQVRILAIGVLVSLASVGIIGILVSLVVAAVHAFGAWVLLGFGVLLFLVGCYLVGFSIVGFQRRGGEGG